MRLLSRLFSRGESSADRGAWIDSAVQNAADRALERYVHAARTASRSFETAETPPYTESWTTYAGELNSDLWRQLPTLRSRSRNLARNNEWATRYLLQLDDNVLGEQGIRLQARVKLGNGEQDKRTNELLEAAFAQWCERGNCEVTGKLTWRECESLALSTLARDGELLYRMRPGAGPLGFQIQFINPALLDVQLRMDYNGNRVRMGVELTDDGKPVAYWIRVNRSGDAYSDLITAGKHVRIPAEQIRHCFVVEEIDQIRGLPWLTVGARRLWLLHDFEEAAAVASSNAAKRQGFFVSPSGDAPPGFADTIVSSVLDAAKAAGKVLTPEEIQTITAAAEKHATTVPGQFDTLPTGYDFRPFESQWPNLDAGGYVKSQVRGWAAARGISYVSLGNDLESVNYSSAQIGMIGERDRYKTLQSKLVSWLHAEVFAAAVPYLVLKTSGLKASRLPEYIAAATWQPRRWQPVDPVKAANANETNLRLRLTSRRRIQLERGEDPDEIAAEIAAEEKLYGPLDGPAAKPRTKPDAEDEEGADSPGDGKETAGKFLA